MGNYAAIGWLEDLRAGKQGVNAALGKADHEQDA